MRKGGGGDMRRKKNFKKGGRLKNTSGFMGQIQGSPAEFSLKGGGCPTTYSGQFVLE